MGRARSLNLTGEFIPQHGVIGKYIRIYAEEEQSGPIPFEELSSLLYNLEPLTDDTVFELNDMDSSGLVLRMLSLWIRKRGTIHMRTNSPMMREVIKNVLGDAVQWVD